MTVPKKRRLSRRTLLRGGAGVVLAGDWMFHCHILEHQAGGMMGTIRVS